MPKRKAAADQLKLRHIAVDTFHENVAYMHGDCEVYRAEGFQALSKIRISVDGRGITAVLNIVRDERIVGTDELGLCDQAFDQLELEEGTPLAVEHAEHPRSMRCVRRKIEGERLTRADFQAITREIADNQYSKLEMAAFLVATDQGGLDRDEVLDYTEAMADTGRRRRPAEKSGRPGTRRRAAVPPARAVLIRLRFRDGDDRKGHGFSRSAHRRGPMDDRVSSTWTRCRARAVATNRPVRYILPGATSRCTPAVSFVNLLLVPAVSLKHAD